MKKTAIRAILLVTVIPLSLAVTAKADDTLRERFEQTIEVEPGVEIRLRNTNGNVVVTTWEREAVEIIAEKRARSGDREEAEKALEEIVIDIESRAGTLEIETRLPRRSSGVMSWLFGRHVDASVSYELRIPAAAGLDVATVNGSVTTDGPGGRQRLGSTNGRIRAEAARAAVEASTVNGSIDVELAGSPGDAEIEASTTNGSITLRIPADLAGRLEARTVNGSVRSDIPVTIHGTTSKRRMSADLNGGGETRIGLRTINGSIRIRES